MRGLILIYGVPCANLTQPGHGQIAIKEDAKKMFIQKVEQLELLKVAELPQASRRFPFHQLRPPGTHHTHLRMKVIVGLCARS